MLLLSSISPIAFNIPYLPWKLLLHIHLPAAEVGSHLRIYSRWVVVQLQCCWRAFLYVAFLISEVLTSIAGILSTIILSYSTKVQFSVKFLLYAPRSPMAVMLSLPSWAGLSSVLGLADSHFCQATAAAQAGWEHLNQNTS